MNENKLKEILKSLIIIFCMEYATTYKNDGIIEVEKFIDEFVDNYIKGGYAN